MKTRLALGALMAAACAYAQPSCTTIVGPVYQNNTATVTTLVAGSYIDVISTYTPIGGATQGKVRIVPVAGNFSQCLPPATYAAVYSVKNPSPLTGSTTYTRTWTIPTGGPYTVQMIEGSGPIPAYTTIALPQISTGAVGNGTYCVQVEGGVITALVVCGASPSPGGHVTWSTLGHVAWESIGHKTWGTIGN